MAKVSKDTALDNFVAEQAGLEVLLCRRGVPAPHPSAFNVIVSPLLVLSTGSWG